MVTPRPNGAQMFADLDCVEVVSSREDVLAEFVAAGCTHWVQVKLTGDPRTHWIGVAEDSENPGTGWMAGTVYGPHIWQDQRRESFAYVEGVALVATLPSEEGEYLFLRGYWQTPIPAFRI